MSEAATKDELARIRALIPLHSLPDEAFDELLDSAVFDTLSRGAMLFEQGDTGHEHVYLLEGRVSLLSDGRENDSIEAGSGTARFPIAHQLPRKHGARAASQVRIVRLDSRNLSDLLARAQTVDYQVDDLEDASEDDWMGMLLQSRVLQQVPAANIQRVMMSVEQVDVFKGMHLISQGDPGDYYYVLTRGRAVVRRDNNDGKGPVELATLGPGDAFGEEALLSDNPRNSSITMLQDGHVLRLGKENFLDLIQNPLLDKLSMADAVTKVEQGAVWLDLRGREQFDEAHLPGAINFPFESLRYQTSTLDPEGRYVLYSNTGQRAMAGAFLLTERGFDVSVLENGIAPNQLSAAVTEAPGAGAENKDQPGDDAARKRIHEAEQRARELERRLQEAERQKEQEESERQQQMQQVSAAVDQARRKLLETEEQKKSALAAQQQAYADMEKLTDNLEAVESERASLSDRMAEIEGLDKQLQARLVKAERELIGERERAESATSSLDDLSRRLSGVMAQREQERDQHARERGELIEDVTGLQMELEQAQIDLEELQGRVDSARSEQAADDEALKAANQRLEEMEAANRSLQAARDGLSEERDRLLSEKAAAVEQLDAGTQTLAAREQEKSQVLQALEASRADLEAARAEIAQLQAALVQAGQDTRESLDVAGAELQQANAALVAEHQAASDAAAADMAQATGRIAELEQALQAATVRQRELELALEEQAGRLLDDGNGHQGELGALTEQLGQAQSRTQQLEGLLDEKSRENAQLLEQQNQVGKESQEALDDALRRVDELEQRIDAARQKSDSRIEQATQEIEDLRAELAEAGAAPAAGSGELDMELEMLRSANEHLEAQLAAAQPAADAVDELEQRLVAQQHQSAGELAAAQAEVAKARADAEALRNAPRAAAGPDTDDEAVGTLRDTNRSLSQRLEEREMALAAAREEQAELIRALNAAGSELEALQLVASDRETDRARLLDLENQLTDLHRSHEKAILAHEQEQRRLRDRVAAESQRSEALLAAQDGGNTTMLAVDGDEDISEREALLAELAARESEVEQLRTVIHEYVEQIRDAKSTDNGEQEVAALRAELEMVREQAVHDVADMRAQLSRMELGSRRLNEAGGRELVSQEVMRQQIEELESSLNERQREYNDAQASQNMLEDELEDAHRQLDEAQRELEKARHEADVSMASRREAESAKGQLEEALLSLQQNVDQARTNDLRDARLSPTGPMAAGRGGARWWLAGLSGAVAAVLGLEGLSHVAGGKGFVIELLRGLGL